jgi:hypothetical protein
MGHILGAIGPLLKGVQSVAQSIDILKGKGGIKVNTLFGDLNNLMVTFQKVSDLFGKIKGAIFSSGGIDAKAMQPMKDALKAISDALAGLPAAVQGAQGAANDLKMLIANMTSSITSQQALTGFNNAGKNLVQQLQNGMHDQLIVAQARESYNIGLSLGVILAGANSKAAYDPFRNTGKNLVQQMQNGFHDQLFQQFVPREKTNLSTAMNNLATHINSKAELKKFHDAGVAVVDEIKNGLEDPGAKLRLAGALVGVVGALSRALLDPAIVHQFFTLGQNLMLGLSSGINDKASQVSAAAVKAALDAKNAAADKTQTTSPSKLFAKLGSDWMAGLALGIGNSSNVVKTAAGGAVPTPRLAPATGGMHVNVTANFTINAPGGNADAIRRAIETDSAHQFAGALLTSVRAGAGTVY